MGVQKKCLKDKSCDFLIHLINVEGKGRALCVVRLRSPRAENCVGSKSLNWHTVVELQNPGYRGHDVETEKGEGGESLL